MYQKLTLTTRSGTLLKPFHHIYLKKDFIQDCVMWKQFLNQQEECISLCRPFVDFTPDNSSTFHTLPFYSDVSLNKNLGMGTIYGNNWLQCMWNPQFIVEESPSIEFLELFTLTMALITWGKSKPSLQNTRVQIFCDNEAVVFMVNKLASSCAQCRKLIRIITLEGLKYNRRVYVEHIRSKDNILLDVLSRKDMAHFWKNVPSSMESLPMQADSCLWPVEKLWFWDAEYLQDF